jgi:hypothetical protein
MLWTAQVQAYFAFKDTCIFKLIVDKSHRAPEASKFLHEINFNFII